MHKRLILNVFAARRAAVMCFAEYRGDCSRGRVAQLAGARGSHRRQIG